MTRVATSGDIGEPPATASRSASSSRAGDLHDDIGSNLSQIAILSEVARRRLDGAAVDVAEALERIGTLSRESVDAMGDIVWAVDPRKDRLGNLVQRMRRLAADRLAASDIELRFEAEHDEGLNNAFRHSGCRTVTVDLRSAEGHLALQVRDDGRGFDPRGVRHGHGVDSMRRRAESLGGRFDLVSREGGGTSITLRVPLGRA